MERKALILNGSPRKNGTVARLLKAVAEGTAARSDVYWIDVCDLNVQPCRGCMKCRPDGECALPPDDAHRVGRLIREADAVVVGTPTHQANMSAPLKNLLDRIVPAIMGERPGGLPIQRQKGKKAAIVTACATPWPFHALAGQSRGAIRAVAEVLKTGGYRIEGTLVKPGTRKSRDLEEALLARARRLGRGL